MLDKCPFQITEVHLAGCKRGELNLNHDELLLLNKFLASGEGSPAWRFVLVPTATRGLKLPAFSAVKPVAKTTSSTAPSETTKRQMPEWAVTFQRMLHKFLQSDIAKPFADRLPHVNEPITLSENALHEFNIGLPEFPKLSSAADQPAALVATTPCGGVPPPITRHSLLSQHQREIYSTSQPHPGILSPKQVLTRIENGEYTHCLDAFNDLYNYFLCGFRHYPPGSPHWILLHYVVNCFFLNLGAFPLKDSFDGPPSVIKQTERKPSERRSGAQKPHRPPIARQPAANAVVVSPEEMPIKRKETRALHRILSALGPELHQMLYDAFKDKAVWKMNEAGQVQLNERETSAPVFRQLLNWGASRVTWQVSSSKKKQQLRQQQQQQQSMMNAAASAQQASATAASDDPAAGDPTAKATTTGGQKYEDWLSSSDPDKQHSSSSSSDNASSDRSNSSSDSGGSRSGSDDEDGKHERRHKARRDLTDSAVPSTLVNQRNYSSEDSEEEEGTQECGMVDAVT